MELDNPNHKIIAASALGALGGLLLAGYFCKAKQQDTPLSKHVSALSKLIEQFEGIDDSDSENLKERIESLLTTIEKNYAKPEE